MIDYAVTASQVIWIKLSESDNVQHTYKKYVPQARDNLLSIS